jgi:glycolate oxidase FAD binding subunit
MTAAGIADELQRAAPGARILSGGGVDGYEVDGLRPAAVVQPADAKEVASIVRLAAERGLALIPRGGGTAIEQGNSSSRLDLVLELTRLDRVVEHYPQDLTVTAQAGVPIGALQRALAQHGQMLALDPPVSKRATVGGVLAANGFGPRRQRYGTARDLLIGSRAVLADGSQVRAGGKVVKNVAGYDLNKLWIGSHGTLAVITEATFKVAPLPGGFGMLLAAFADLDQAATVALDIARSPLQPLTLDLIGPPTAQRLTAESRAEPGADAWVLAVELGGSPAAVERTTRELVLLATAGGSPEVTALEAEQRETLMRRLRDYGRSEEDPAAAILRASVLPSETVQAIHAVEAVAGADRPAVIVRAGSGVVYSYWERAAMPRLAIIVEGLRGRVGRIGGTVVVERMPAGAKAAIETWSITGPDVELMRRLKAVYDPTGVLSPGRMV